jgi:peptidoglycan/xylan/chitin deacetylase (PgdA/CDA1 family)
MRILVFALAAGLALSGCKRPNAEPAAEVVAAATPTPAPTPEATPTPEPIDLNSQVIVFCYHRFEEKPKDSLAIKPSDFEAQMQALKDQGITVISMEDFLAWRRGEKAVPKKSAVITIDDGYVSGYSVAWPILQKFGYPFTMFIYTDYVKGGPKSGGQSITWAQLAEMRDAGVDIGSHTVSHSALNAKKGRTDDQYREWLKHELAGSKEKLEAELGIQVKTLAYPYGLHNDLVRQVAMESGYEAAFTVYGQRLLHDADAPMLGRYAIESTKPDVFEKAAAFSGPVSNAAAGATAMPAAATMVTQPMEGEVVTASEPEIKANLATLGNVDPKSVSMRISGLGVVPATYDPETKLLTYTLKQRVYSRNITVIVSATANGKKVETRWSFQLAPPA